MLQGLRAIVHVAALELSCTGRRVWSHWTHGDAGALPSGGPSALDMWRRQSLPMQGTGLELQDTWQLRSPPPPGVGFSAMGYVVTTEPSIPGGEFGAVGHVATPDPSPGGWCARCHGACTESGTRGGTGALPYQVRSLAPWGWT
jgi:hypothetical protein